VVTLLVLAAFVLSVIAVIIAVIVSVTRRRQVSVLEKEGIQTAMQLDVAKDGPQAFEAAVAASQKAHRARLSRKERIRRILTPIAFGLSGLIVIFALAAFFLAGDREAATVCAMMAAFSFSFTTIAYLSAKHAR
jgi:heme exporter protein D